MATQQVHGIVPGDNSEIHDEMQAVEERRTELAAKTDGQTTLTPPDES